MQTKYNYGQPNKLKLNVKNDVIERSDVKYMRNCCHISIYHILICVFFIT